MQDRRAPTRPDTVFAPPDASTQEDASRFSMNAPLPSYDADLRDKVLAWCVRRGRDTWSPADEAGFQAWLAGSSDRREAWAEWEARWKALDGIPAEAIAALRSRLALDKARHAAGAAAPAWAARRRLVPVLASVALAVVAGGSALLAWSHWQAQPVYAQVFASARGQQVEARLPDGSQLRLDTATRLEVTYYRQRREVKLIDGQALFSVQPDAARPFQVLAGPVGVTVVGTRFSVRYTPGIAGASGVRVAVEQGQVRVARLDAGDYESADAVHLTAGQEVQADARGVLSPAAPVASDDIAPWRRNRVSFVNTPLDQALAELGRYGSTQLVVRDPGVAQLRLSGTFDPRDVQTLRRVLPMALPVRLTATSEGQAEIVPAR